MEQKYIRKVLRPLKNKILFQNGIRLFFIVLNITGAACFVLAFLSLFIVIPFTRMKLLAVLGSSIPVSIIGSLFVMPSWKHVMIAADNLGLKERVITAYCLKDDNSAVAELQRQDTKSALENARVESRYSINISKPVALTAVIFICAAFLLSFIPGTVHMQTQLRQSLITEIKRQEKLIEQTANEQIRKHQLSNEQLEELRNALEKLKEGLKQAKTEEDALKGLAQMENLMEIYKSRDSVQPLEKLQRALTGSALTEKIAETLKSENEEALQQALEQLKKELDDRFNREELSELLAQAAQSIPDNPMLTEKLQELAASAAVQSTNSADISKSLSELLKMAEENAQHQQSFQHAAEEIGKAVKNARSAIASVDQNITAQKPATNSQTAQRHENDQRQRKGQQDSIGNDSDGSGKGSEQNQPGGEQAGDGNKPGDNGTGGGNKPGGGAGEGTTGIDAGYTEGEQAGYGKLPGSRKEKEYERIYIPERLGGEGNETVLEGQKLESGSSYFSESDGAPVQKGSMVRWQDVLTEYREDAVQSMERLEIPPGLRTLVRDYFSSLE